MSSRRAPTPLAWLFALAAGAGCAGLPDVLQEVAAEGSEADAFEGYWLRSALFRLSVDTEGVTLHDDRPGFSLTNDLGHHIEVREAWLSFSAASLTACAAPTASLSPTRLLSRVFVGAAHAGHGEDYGAASVLRPLVEDLASPAPVDVGAVDFDTARYCSAHYLAGYAPDTAEHVERVPLMAGRTLLVSGWVQRLDEERVGFQIATDLNYGQLVQLKELMGPVASDDIALTVTRSLVTMFDGVDVIADDDAGAAVLWNLAGGAVLTVAALSDGV